MAIKVEDALTEFGYLKEDVSDIDSDAFVQWCKQIQSYVYRKLKGVDPSRFTSTESYTATTTAQALPTGFRDMTPSGCGLFLLNDDGTVANKLTNTEFGATEQGYYILGNDIYFTGLTNSESITMVYIPKLTQIADYNSYFTVDATDTGTVLIEDEFLDYLLQALDVKYNQWNDSAVDEGNADQRFVRALDDMLSEYDRTPQTIILPSINNYF